MGLLASLKEKIADPKAADRAKLNQKELQNLDALIEDLFRLDDQETAEKKTVKAEK
jgi:hypothetical protein